MAKENKKQETKEVVPMAMNSLELQAAKETGEQEVVASDVLIPRLLLMQGISPLVTSRKAHIADMIRSTTEEKLGDPENPIDIVPLKMVNTWINFEDTGEGQPKFRGQEDRNASNEHLPWDYTGPEGEEMSRRKAITLYALIPADVALFKTEVERAEKAGDAPDLTRTVMPVVLTFQSTSFKYAGKKCASFFSNVRVWARSIPSVAPFAYTLRLKCQEEKAGKNSWYVYDFEKPVALKDKSIREEAARWALILGKSNIRVDDRGEVAESHSVQTRGSTVAEMEV